MLRTSLALGKFRAWDGDLGFKHSIVEFNGVSPLALSVSDRPLARFPLYSMYILYSYAFDSCLICLESPHKFIYIYFYVEYVKYAY